MSDITERLRRLYVNHGTDYVQEAADLIDQLRVENAALRESLRDRFAMAGEALKAALDERCVWESSGRGLWKTGCDEFIYSNGPLDVRFCVHCGNPVEVKDGPT